MEASSSRGRSLSGSAALKRRRGSSSGLTAQSLNDEILRSVFSRLDDHFCQEQTSSVSSVKEQSKETEQVIGSRWRSGCRPFHFQRTPWLLPFYRSFTFFIVTAVIFSCLYLSWELIGPKHGEWYELELGLGISYSFFRCLPVGAWSVCTLVIPLSIQWTVAPTPLVFALVRVLQLLLSSILFYFLSSVPLVLTIGIQS
jgi:hypothetical protein